MKRLLLFLLFLGLGSAVLVYAAGGLDGRRKEGAEPRVPVHAPETSSAPTIAPGSGIPEVRAGQGITQMAPPRRVVWKDKLSDETIVIDSFFPWRFKTKDFQPLPMADGVKQGVLCKDVLFELYREPATRAEALALKNLTGRDAYAALLGQRFQAGEARVFGRLGEALARTQEKNAAARDLGDTKLLFTNHVVIEDRAQGFQIHGGEGTVLEVWPEQERAVGRGLYTLKHEALELDGTGLTMERDKAQGSTRITIQTNPRLRVHSEGRGADGKPLFDFGPGDFRPLTVHSAGRAIVVREERRREVVLTISFRDDVSGKQEGGSSLHAGRADLVAVRGMGHWRLRRFEAAEGVELEYPGQTSKGERYVASVTAKRLVHEVPAAGTPTSVFEGFPVITMRGELSMLGPGAYLRASCHDRAWIGPLMAGAPDCGLPRGALQQIGLRGGARVERHDPGSTGENDAIEGEAIDLVMWPKRAKGGAPASRPGETPMVAVYFAAVGDVRLDGARVTGSTHRLVAEDLHTPRPHVTAEGRDTRFSFLQLGREQRLLGTDREAPGAQRPGGQEGESTRWTLRRLLARGRVDIDTSLGGPALGIPATLDGDEVSYDGVSNRALVRALGSAPARVGWTSSRTRASHIETREITLDRAAGSIKATGGVIGEIYVRKRGTGGRSFGVFGSGDVGPRVDGATLTVRTDQRIDIDIARNGTANQPARDEEQTIRIAGPVTTELRSSERVVDRMRSDRLEVVLAYETRATRADGPATDHALVIDRAAGAGPREATPLPADDELQKVDIRARTLRIDLAGKEARYLEADGNVDLASARNHVEGERLIYDGDRRRVEVRAGARPARVLLGQTAQRSEVTAQRLVVLLADGRVRRLEAHAPDGGESSMELFRTDAKHGRRLEWYAVTYQGTLAMTDSLLTTDRVLVVRRLREPGSGNWGLPTILRSPTLKITGSSMLATEEDQRVIREIIAEGTGPGRTGEVNFQSGAGENLAQAFGHRLRFDVAAQQAVLTGLPGRDVRIAYGSQAVTDHKELRIDLASSIPTYSQGSRMLWRPPEKR